MTGYELSRKWFDFCFENPEKINPNHTAIFFFAIEHCNRLGWKEKFGFPTQMAMDAIGIKKHDTYIKYFNDLCDWGFFKLVQKSSNQYSSNIICLWNANPKNGEALGKAIQKHAGKHSDSIGESNPESNPESNGSINKPLTNNLELNNNKQNDVFSFDEFWEKYPVKVAKSKCKPKYEALPEKEKVQIFKTLALFVKHKPFSSYHHPNPETYLNQKRWQDELPQAVQSTKITFVDPDRYGEYNQYLADCKKHGIAQELMTPEYYYSYGR